VIAAEYPLGAYPAPDVAFSTLVSDANFACPALQVDSWTSELVPTFAYQFNDDNAPQRLTPPGALPPIATHSTELQYLFDLPNTPFPGTFNADQQALAASMRTAWASFAARGDPLSANLPWPSFDDGGRVMSLVPPQPQVETGFSAIHHCAFWGAGADGQDVQEVTRDYTGATQPRSAGASLVTTTSGGNREQQRTTHDPTRRRDRAVDREPHLRRGHQ
jgi:para-nitrobenzyl esterase